MRRRTCVLALVVVLVCGLAACDDDPPGGSVQDGGAAGAAGSAAGSGGKGGTGGSSAVDAGTAADGGATGACKRGGCSGELCGEPDDELVSGCEFRPEYACYQKATCERQPSSKCGFTPSAELAACLANAADGGSSGAYTWYETCGFPVCMASPVNDPAVDDCTSEKTGEACSTKGAECDLANECGTHLRCTDEDPTAQPGGCPISRARYKRDIAYLSAAERERVYRDLLAIPLASYAYKSDPAATPQLGFILEDVEPSPATRGDRVNLYGYLSMAVNAVQLQAKQIEALEREVIALRALASERHVSCEP